MANNRLDIIIFGATGDAGKYVVKNVTHMCKEQKMKFSIAGRRKEALDAVVKEFASDIEDVPIIPADIKDEDSLKKIKFSIAGRRKRALDAVLKEFGSDIGIQEDVSIIPADIKDEESFKKMKFGIAGRRKGALEAVVKEFASDIEDVPIILADIKDEESLKKMTERAKILINCCSLYSIYGESVIKACIATRTHYVDVTTEEQFMEKMQLEYNEAAKEAGIYVVNACGFNCVPTDLGIIFTQKKFGGEVNDIEVYMEMWSTSTESKRPYLNYTNWEMVVYSLAHANELRELHEKLYPTKLPEFTPKLRSRGLVHRSDVAEGWSVPFSGAEGPVSLRTQRFLYDKYNERPAQIEVYATFKSFFMFLKFFIVGMILSFMTRTACCRNLLLKYPSLFSFGFASHENPNLEVWDSTHYSITFKARGWTEKLAEPTDKHTNPPNKEVITKVTGDSPAYEGTSITAILSAVTILNESDKIPDNGGVLTPGTAFGKTSLIEQLNKHNIKFEVISSTEK